MNNHPQQFMHPKFGALQIIYENGNPLFAATQAATLLGYANPRKAIIDHCRSEGVTKRYSLTDGGTQQVNYINEGNLYRLIVKSQLPEAQEFEKWIFDEVIPTIRKTGNYQMQAMSQMEMIAAIAQRAAEKEKEDARRDEQIKALQSGVTTIRETILQKDEDWRNAINKMFNKAVMHSNGKDFQSLRRTSYTMLEERAHCKLDIRLRNLISRMEEQGATKSAISKLSRMDVIEADEKLKAIYTSIVKEISIRYMPGMEVST